MPKDVNAAVATIKTKRTIQFVDWHLARITGMNLARGLWETNCCRYVLLTSSRFRQDSLVKVLPMQVVCWNSAFNPYSAMIWGGWGCPRGLILNHVWGMKQKLLQWMQLIELILLILQSDVLTKEVGNEPDEAVLEWWHWTGHSQS